MKIMVGSGADGSTYAHGTQALDFEALVKRGGLTPGARHPGRHHHQRRSAGMAGPRSARSRRASTPTSSPSPAIPLADITELQRVKFVMKAGKVVVK